MSRSRSRDRGFRGSRTAVDKEKLLAIAKKNAVKLLSSDNLMASWPKLLIQDLICSLAKASRRNH